MRLRMVSAFPSCLFVVTLVQNNLSLLVRDTILIGQ
jgi:hypothetical protein